MLARKINKYFKEKKKKKLNKLCTRGVYPESNEISSLRFKWKRRLSGYNMKTQGDCPFEKEWKWVNK